MNVCRILLSAGFLAFAFAAAANGLDRTSSKIASVERVVPEPFRAQAHRSAAAIGITRGHLEEGLSEAARSVASDPVDPDGAPLLGTARLLAGDDEGAERAFRVAARFGWRNLATQGYWLSAAVGVRDFEVAMDRADAILRVHGARVSVDALLEPFESDEAGQAVLAKHLRRSPEWQSEYLSLANPAPTELINRRLEVLALVMKGDFRFDCSMMSEFVDGLLQNGRADDAVHIWNRNCPDLAVSHGLTDPRFALLASESLSPFGWKLRRSGDLFLNIRGDGANRRLILVNRASAARMVMDQVTNLAPGTYRIDVEGDEQADGRIKATFGCDEAPRRPLPSDADRVFTVGRCEQQRLALWLGPTQELVQVEAITASRVR